MSKLEDAYKRHAEQEARQAKADGERMKEAIRAKAAIEAELRRSKDASDKREAARLAQEQRNLSDHLRHRK